MNPIHSLALVAMCVTPSMLLFGLLCGPNQTLQSWLSLELECNLIHAVQSWLSLELEYNLIHAVQFWLSLSWNVTSFTPCYPSTALT